MNQPTTTLLISCDWGTSNFRLRLLDTKSGLVTGEVLTGNGVAKLNESFLQQNGGRSRLDFFLSYLQSQINILGAGADVEGVGVVISGMASSRIGMKELPYAKLPSELDGRSLVTEVIAPGVHCAHEVLLVSGAAANNEVMRGEETQLLGLHQLLDPSRGHYLCIMPGTHSKHVLVQNHQIQKFKTFITGELFSLLLEHSLLKESVERSLASTLADDRKEAFIQGVAESANQYLTNALFLARTNVLLGTYTKTLNYFYLSGLLIGSELRAIPDNNLPIYLAADTALETFYTTAMQTLGLMPRTTLVASGLVEKSIAAAHLLLNKISRGYDRKTKRYS